MDRNVGKRGESTVVPRKSCEGFDKRLRVSLPLEDVLRDSLEDTVKNEEFAVRREDARKFN